MPFLPSIPCLPGPEFALPWIRKRCWAIRPAASKPLPHISGFLECAFTDLQWLPIFPKGICPEELGRGFLWCPSGFLRYLLCVSDTPQRVASDSFPWVFAAISYTQKDLDHWLFTKHLPGRGEDIDTTSKAGVTGTTWTSCGRKRDKVMLTEACLLVCRNKTLLSPP